MKIDLEINNDKEFEDVLLRYDIPVRDVIGISHLTDEMVDIERITNNIDLNNYTREMSGIYDRISEILSTGAYDSADYEHLQRAMYVASANIDGAYDLGIKDMTIAFASVRGFGIETDFDGVKGFYYSDLFLTGGTMYAVNPETGEVDWNTGVAYA